MADTVNPELLDEVARRGITSLVHFLPIKNLIGVLDNRRLLCRKKLPDYERLRYVLSPNVSRQWDKDWTGYVSLSIERINLDFLNASRIIRRDGDNRWCILEFDPVILAHQGVSFATTNNIYPSVVRDTGINGFSQLFASTVNGKRAQKITRTKSHRESWTTDRQAEVLYPNAVDCHYLNRIVTESEQDSDTVAGIIRGVMLEPVAVPEVKCIREMFQ